MSNILDQVAKSQQFTPATTDEFLALQLAKRLNDEAAIGKYLHYVAHHPLRHLLYHFHRAKKKADSASAFHLSIKPYEP